MCESGAPIAVSCSQQAHWKAELGLLQRRFEEDEKRFPLDSEITCMCKDDVGHMWVTCGSCDYIIKLNTINVVDPCLAILDVSDFRKQWVKLPEFGVTDHLQL